MSAEWEWMAWPCCCEEEGETCNVCTFPGLRPTSWIVDMGAGGWIDDLCDKCDEITGEFTADEYLTFPNPQACESPPEACCAWRYRNMAWCKIDTMFGPVWNMLNVLLSIVNLGGGQWRYRLTVKISGLGGTESLAQYASASTANPDCQGEFVAGKIPLIKWFDHNESGWGGRGSCTGALPAIVYAWPEP